MTPIRGVLTRIADFINRALASDLVRRAYLMFAFPGLTGRFLSAALADAYPTVIDGQPEEGVDMASSFLLCSMGTYLKQKFKGFDCKPCQLSTRSRGLNPSKEQLRRKRKQKNGMTKHCNTLVLETVSRGTNDI